MSLDNGHRAAFATADIDERTARLAAPRRAWAAPTGLVVAAAAGTLMFWQLNENRARIETARLTDPAPRATLVGLQGLPAPDLAAAIAAQAAAPPTAATAPAADALAPPASIAPDAGRNAGAPSLIVDLSEATDAESAEAPGGGPVLTAEAVTGALAPGAADADARFAARLGVGQHGGPTQGHQMTNLPHTIVQGAVIPAVLETAVNSDLPGFVRAIVSRDVRGFDGANVLVPRGSRLIGQYRAGVALGQSRAFVIWTRLVRPDGVSVDLAAPATDALGRGGIEGRVDRHFLQRFGGAILLSLITAGGHIAAADADTQVIIASTRAGAGDATAAALQRDLDIPPTVRTPQGAAVRVFVTRDLDFTDVGAPS